MPRTSPPAPKRAAAPRSAGQAPATHSTLVETAELAPHLGDPRLVIVDVRHDLADSAFGEAAYAKSHIPGAVFAHVDRDLSAPRSPHSGRHPLPTPEAAAKLFGRLGIGATKQVVAYDQGNGVYASRLWWMLRWLGHDSVAVLDGGFAKWMREGRPVSTDVPHVAPAKFVATNVLPTVNATGIAASLPRHGLLLLDARTAERYRGDADPSDPGGDPDPSSGSDPGGASNPGGGATPEPPAGNDPAPAQASLSVAGDRPLRAAVNRIGRFSVPRARLRCRLGSACTIGVKVLPRRRGSSRLGGATLRLRPGAEAALRARLNRATRRALRRDGRMRVRLRVALPDGGTRTLRVVLVARS